MPCAVLCAPQAERTHHRLRVCSAAKKEHCFGYRLPSRAQEMARRVDARVKGSSEKTEKAVLPASPNQGGTVWAFASPLLTGTGLFILREEMF